MTWNDATAVTVLIEQLEGLRGEPVEIAEASWDLVAAAAERARHSRSEHDTLHLFRLVWQYPAVRRQPWVAGFKPYIAWRLYGAMPRIVASILAGDLLDNQDLASGWGRDSNALWLPDVAFRIVIDDLDLVRDPAWRIGHPLPDLEIAGDWPAQFLIEIAGASGMRCMLHRPGHWCSSPGRVIELTSTPGPLLEELLAAYRQRPAGAMATPVAVGYEWLAGLVSRALPSMQEIMQHPVPAVQAFRVAAGNDTWDQNLAAAHAIPADFRWLVLLHPTKPTPLHSALGAFLTEQLGRYVTNGLYLSQGGERAIINDVARDMQRVELLLYDDAHVWIDAVVVPVMLCQLGLCAESAALSTRSPRWRNPSWQELVTDWGLGPLLAAAWPLIRHAEPDSPNASAWWLAVPAPLDQVVRAACISPNADLAEADYHDDPVENP